MDERTLMLIVGILAGILGGLANYGAMKKQKGTSMTKEGTGKAALIGLIAGFLFWLEVPGTGQVYQISFTITAFILGLGGETALGKLIGQLRIERIAIPLYPPTSDKDKKEDE